MKQFKHIEIHKDKSSLMQLVEKMKNLKNDFFVYNSEASDKVNEECASDTICSGVYYALFTAHSLSLYFTTVYVSINDNVLKVDNIISSDSRFSNLGISRYNFVINSFFHHFMAKCLDESYKNCIFLSGETISLEEVLGKDVFQALKAWESSCNKEHPISNPTDEQLWFEFLCRLYTSGKNLHSSDFSQWLSEDCKWPSLYNSEIEKMAEFLEYSLSLLKYHG